MHNPDTEGDLNHVKPRKAGVWTKIGGGSLLFATLFHVILLVIGAFWAFQIVQQPEKKVDFMPPGGSGSRSGFGKRSGSGSGMGMGGGEE